MLKVHLKFSSIISLEIKAIEIPSRSLKTIDVRPLLVLESNKFFVSWKAIAV